MCIIGAGLAGLACARDLTDAGVDVVVLDASQRVGGRVATDAIDGFLVDRGFQILLTAYPEVQRRLDLDALELQRFDPGAVVQIGRHRHLVADPLRRPRALVDTIRAPVGTPADKLRLARLVASVRRGRPADLLGRTDCATIEALDAAGFTDRMIDRFFRPLFSGIQLDPALEVSSRRFEIILRMLAVGDSAVPAGGMGAIPSQLAAGLPEGCVRLGAAVDALDGTTVCLTDGTTIDARAVVVATDGPTAHRLLGDQMAPVVSRQVACAWFSPPEPTGLGSTLLLDGDRSGPVANLAEMSAVAPTYAPGGRHLVVAAMPIGRPVAAVDTTELLGAARRQLGTWFGGGADWELVALQHIEHGHPHQPPGFPPKRRVELGDGRFVCGDHRDTASIQGALFSGGRCAQAVRQAVRSV